MNKIGRRTAEDMEQRNKKTLKELSEKLEQLLDFSKLQKLLPSFRNIQTTVKILSQPRQAKKPLESPHYLPSTSFNSLQEYLTLTFDCPKNRFSRIKPQLSAFFASPPSDQNTKILCSFLRIHNNEVNKLEEIAEPFSFPQLLRIALSRKKDERILVEINFDCSRTSSESFPTRLEYENKHLGELERKSSQHCCRWRIILLHFYSLRPNRAW
jgi:hypothetical protein